MFILTEEELATQHAQWKIVNESVKGLVNVSATCNRDMREQVPACHQFGSMWCWATGIAEFTEYYTGTGPWECEGLECKIISWCPKAGSSGRCGASEKCCPLEQHPGCGSYGATMGMLTEAATHFTGRTMIQTGGPMSQEVLDRTLQAGHPIMMLVGYVIPQHVVTVVGCGGGQYYYHDPEWSAGRYESVTYDKLLHSIPEHDGAKWFNTIVAAGADEFTTVV